MVSYDIYSMQFNLTRLGLPELPTQIDPKLCDQVREAFASRNMTMTAICGHFNMAHPDKDHRANGLDRVRPFHPGEHDKKMQGSWF